MAHAEPHPTVAALDLEAFMRAALEEARLAGEGGSLPIGAVVVLEGRIVGRGHNTSETGRNQLLHAELNALNGAAEPLWAAGPRWALRDRAVLFTTLEPCPMCLGAAVMADIPHVVFAARDGNVCSAQSVRDNPYIRRHIQTYLGGVLEAEARALVERFAPEMLPGMDRTD